MLRAAAIAERAGVPSVSIVTTPFMQQAGVVSKGIGLPSLPIAEYPGVPMTDGSDAVARKVEALLPQLVAGLAGARDTGRPTAAEPGPRDVVHRGTLDEIQELFLPVFVQPEKIGILVAGDAGRNQSKGYVNNHIQGGRVSKRVSA